MRLHVKLMILVLGLALCACHSARNDPPPSAGGPAVLSGVDPNYALVLTQIERDRQRDAVRRQDERAAVSQCQADQCWALALIAVADRVGNGQGNALPAPPRQRDWAEKFRDVTSAITQPLGILAPQYAAIKQSDNLRDIEIARQQGQLGMVTAVVNANAAVATGATTAATQIATAGPRIEVGGSLVVGDGNAIDGAHIGDTLGNDATFGDRLDNSGTIVDGDGNRFDSPDTTDNSGGSCPGGAGGEEGNGAPGGNCSGGG